MATNLINRNKINTFLHCPAEKKKIGIGSKSLERNQEEHCINCTNRVSATVDKNSLNWLRVRLRQEKRPMNYEYGISGDFVVIIIINLNSI